jgi:hypothetical protein
LLALVPFAGLAAAIALGIVFSFAYGAIYAIMYVLPHFWRDLPAEEVPVAIGLFNSIQLSGGAAISFLFGWVVGAYGYGVAWAFLPLAMLATLLVLFALPPTPAAPAVGPPLAVDVGPP